MTDDGFLALPYRPNAGLVVLSETGKIFAGRRLDTPDAWQMPQGGIDKGEEPETAAFRELAEETGIQADMVELLASTPDWIKYDFPPEVAQKLWKNKQGTPKYRGQRQRWFLMRFVSGDHEINIQTDAPEFSEWAWLTPNDLLERIVPFKRGIYEEVLGAFSPWLAR